MSVFISIANMLVYWVLKHQHEKRKIKKTVSPYVNTETPAQVHAGGRLGIDYGQMKIDRTKRARFGDFGCTIYGWPSCGGVIIRNQADAIEMQYLGLDRFEPPITRLKDQNDEDAFCTRLINIGGKWWPGEKRSQLVWRELNGMGTDIEDETDEEMRELWVGWPKSGGVLISEFQSHIGEIKIPEDIGRLRMALTMEERCELLKTKFGAVYYENPQEYTGFSDQYAMLCRDKSTL